MKALLFTMILVLVSAMAAFSENVVRGDRNQLPEIDYSKQFNIKKFNTGNALGFDRSFSAKEFQAKTLQLPSYYGNLKPLPLTEWRSSQPDVYSKTLNLQSFQLKKASDRWSDQLSLREDPVSPDSYMKQQNVATSNVDSKQVDMSGKNVGGQELKDLINRGVKPESVKTGRGFTASQLGEDKSSETSESKEQYKTSSPQK